MSLYVFVIIVVVWNEPSESTYEWTLEVVSTLWKINNIFVSINKGNNSFWSY